MKYKHTQGNWEIITQGNDIEIVCKQPGGDNLNKIAACNVDFSNRYRHYEKTRALNPSEATANAQLIATTPKMFDFLIQLVQKEQNNVIKNWDDVCFEARKIINEAMGNPCPF